MSETTVRKEYGVFIPAKGMVVPVTDDAGERYEKGGDGNQLKLVTRTTTITVSDWTDREGNVVNDGEI